jgi:hypothetical protein
MPNFNSNRTFGIEIEFIGNREQAIQAIQAAGLSCRFEDYNHRVAPHWKVTTDASVGYDNGELVSPILQGENGLEQVRKVCAALRSIGHKVNKACGVHVHVGGQDLSGPELANVFKRYVECETTIDSLMPRSRRLNNNTYCRSLRDYATGIRNANSLHDLRRAFYDERHVKLNVMSYVRQKTIEFRHHSGSLSGEKITNWIQFCVNFVEKSRSTTAIAANPNYNHTPAAPRRRHANSARARAIELIRSDFQIIGAHNRYDSVFSNQLGVPVASLAALVSTLRREGYTIERRRANGAYFVSGIPAGTATATDNNYSQIRQVATFEPAAHSNPFFGLPVEIVNYYEERAQDLASS